MNKAPKIVASFDVDAQKTFTPLCPNELPVAGGHEIVPALNFMASLAQFRVGSKDAHTASAPWVVERHDQMQKPTGLPFAPDTWVRHAEPGTVGFELLDELPEPHLYDYFVWKGVEPGYHPYGACYQLPDNTCSTGVIEVLKVAGVNCVIVGGLALDFCVKHTALQLLAAGFMVILYRPACRAISAQGEVEALAEFDAAGVLIANNEQELTTLVGN